MLIVWIIILILLSLFGIKFSTCGFHHDYLSKNQTNSIKGIFIVLVFLSHINGYIAKSGYAYGTLGDDFFLTILSYIGQLMVVMFLFYSGYGIMESFKQKGEKYVDSMPKRRILSTLLNFDVAVLFYIVLNVILGIKMTAGQIVLSFVAWDSVGNSNWYIFVILICYIITYLYLKYQNNKLFKAFTKLGKTVGGGLNDNLVSHVNSIVLY